MTRIWFVNWHFQSRITLWCRHKSINVFIMGLCWQMPKFIVWHLWSIYFDHHLPLKPSMGKRRKQSCTPNSSKKAKHLENSISAYVSIRYVILFLFYVWSLIVFANIYIKLSFEKINKSLQKKYIAI